MVYEMIITGDYLMINLVFSDFSDLFVIDMTLSFSINSMAKKRTFSQQYQAQDENLVELHRICFIQNELRSSKMSCCKVLDS